MLESNVISRLQYIAQECGATLELDTPEDKSYVDVLLRTSDIDIDVIAPKIHGEYLAYGIESTGLPREIYVSDTNDEIQRSEEILDNVEKLLKKQLTFHPKPSLLNKARGYIHLKIDSKDEKVYLKSNFFKLPVKGGGINKDCSRNQQNIE